VDRRAIFGDAIIRLTANDRGAAPGRSSGQAQAGATADAARSAGTKAQDQPPFSAAPQLLRGLAIDQPNRVWAAGITYIPMACSFLHLVVVMDWYSRYVLVWRLSNTMDTSSCLDALEDARGKGGQKSSTPTRVRNSPAWCLPTSWKRLACGSAERPRALVGQCLRRAAVAQL